VEGKSKKGSKASKTASSNSDQPKVKKGTKKAEGTDIKARSKPGVIATMIEMMTAASAKKPVTRDRILEELIKRFPDRPVRGMGMSVKVQVPHLIRKRKGIDIQKNENGFWIPK